MVGAVLMLNKFQPDQYYQDIFSIDLDQLKKEGIKGMLCDIDNTIVPWSEYSVLEEVIDWFAEVKRRGFKICLLSNGRDERVNYFSKKLSIPAVGLAIKPARKAFRLAQEKLGLEKEEIVVVGDQIFTDIFGGNRMGFKTILVDPLSKKEFFMTRIMRRLERLVFKRREKDE